MSSTAQIEFSDPPTDAISAVKFAPNSSQLLVSSWDLHVYLYDAPDGRLIRKFKHRAPVLDVCFGANDKEAFSSGLDWDVRKLDLETGEQSVLSSHKAAVKCIAYSASTSILVSASWDSTLHIHNLLDPDRVPAVISLTSKPFSISLTSDKLVVAMANRAVYIYDMKAIAAAASQAHPEGDK